MVQTVPKTVWKFLMVQKTIEISLLQFIDKVLPYVEAQTAAVLGQGCLDARCVQTVLGSSIMGPQQLLDKMDMPVVATTGAWGAVLERG